MNLGENVLGSIGPLVEAVEGANSVPYDRNAARTVEADLRQSPRTVGIVREILVDPAGRVDAGFVDQGGPKRVIPDRGHGAVDVGGVEMVHQAIATPTGVTCPINGGARIWHVVDAKGNQIPARGVEVETAVVLHVAAVAGVENAGEESDVWSGSQVGSTARPVAPGSRVHIALVTGIARADRGS